MQWIRTGRQIGQAVKNVQRLRFILRVFAKHGFADIVHRVGLQKFLPKGMPIVAPGEADKSPQVRLREAFEELGPAFVKLGQLLSTRPDLIPESFIEELVRLQDNVHPVPVSELKIRFEKELGVSVDEAFASFGDKPLGSASISQVHTATLKSGEKVVVKIQRPGIEHIIETDISLLAFIANLLDKYVPEIRIVDPKTIVDEFFKTLSLELDFLVEANNMAKMRKNLINHPNVVIPKVYKEYSSERVLTLERFEGIRVNDTEALDLAGIDRRQVIETGVRAFFQSILVDGLFHGDLHGGNLFVLPGNKLGIIDFGIVGRISQRSRDQLANMVVSLLSEDFENLCYLYAELGDAGPAIDFEGFERELRSSLSPYMGLSLNEVNSGRVLMDATRIATRYNIRIPGDWMLVFKSIVTTEGMGRSLDPNFDILEMSQELVRDLVKSQYSIDRITKDLIWVGKDLASLVQTVPRQLKWFLQKVNNNDFSIEIRSSAFDEIKNHIDRSSKRNGVAIISVGLFIASSLSLNYDSTEYVLGYPLLSVIYFSAGSLALLKYLFSR